jgi:sigma-B regulation protein RsbU (phosphoserine phosphatase)
MLLRDKISILFVGVTLVLSAGLFAAGLQREDLAEQRFADVATGGQRALWQQITVAEGKRLDDLAAIVSGLDTVTGAVEAGDRGGLARIVMAVYGRHRVAGDLDVIEITGPDGGLLFTTEPGVRERPVLDVATLARVREGETVAGLRQDSPQRYLLLRAFPLDPDAPGHASMTLGIDAARLLSDFAAAIGTPSFIVNPRGRVVEATDAALWEQVAPAIPLREPSALTVEHGETLYSVTGVPVPDLAGGLAGAVVTLRDTTATLGEAHRVALLTLFGAGLFVLAALVGLHAFLRRAFRPLGDAIGVLRALAAGDTSVTLDAHGDDEIGRIAEAVRTFRANAVALAEGDRHRERQRRRQERFIRRQMETLADSLDSAARQDVLDDLARAFGPTADEPGEGQGTGDQLGVLAVVLRQLSARVIEQHQRLSTMVVELREALVTKTKLIGLQQELEIARQVQLAMVPSTFPQLPTLDVHGHMLPAKEVGGDLYDIFPLDDDRWAFVVGDVSGKGVPAALFMAIAKTLIKSTARYEARPGACIEQVNNLLAAENDQMLFVTLFYGIIDLRDGSIAYVNAGHNPPVIVAADGSVSLLPMTKGIALGIMEGAVYAEGAVVLAPGDAIFMYTDGVTEAFDIDGEQFGDARLETMMARLAGSADMQALIHDVFVEVKGFERGAPQADDITTLALRRRLAP